MSLQPTYTVKMAVVGDTGVGKSSISERFARGTFTEHTDMTIGAAFLAALCDRGTHKVKYQIWDTAGQERYRALAPLYYRHAHVVAVVYDVTNRDSFLSAQRWFKEVKSCLGDRPVYILLGNKTDKEAGRQVPTADAQTYANDHSIQFMEVSAKSGTKIEEAFLAVSDAVRKLESLSSPPASVQLDTPSGEEAWSWSSCCYG